MEDRFLGDDFGLEGDGEEEGVLVEEGNGDGARDSIGLRSFILPD